jgi:hypothetical protein
MRSRSPDGTPTPSAGCARAARQRSGPAVRARTGEPGVRAVAGSESGTAVLDVLSEHPGEPQGSAAQLPRRVTSVALEQPYREEPSAR